MFKQKNIKIIFVFLIVIITLSVVIKQNGINDAVTRSISKVFLNNSSAFAQAPILFMPNLPSRLRHIAEQIPDINNDLINANNELISKISDCSCDLVKSYCKPLIIGGKQIACDAGIIQTKAFGKSCPTLKSFDDEENITIPPTQSTINRLVLDLSYIHSLLTKEVKSGLNLQLETLRSEDAQELKDALGVLLGTPPNFTDGTIYQIIEKAKINVALPNQCKASNCAASCSQDTGFELGMCLLSLPSITSDVGEVKPVKITFEGSVSVEDWPLGKVGITNLKLNLPEKIKMPELPTLKLPEIKISIPEIKIDCPTQSQKIDIPGPIRPSLPAPPKLELDCPNYNPTNNYLNSLDIGQNEEKYREFEWFLETFSWLSGKCFEAVWGEGLDNINKFNAQPEKLQQALSLCFDPAKVAEELITECNEQYANYHPFNPPSGPPPHDPICTYWVKEQPNDRVSRAREHCFKFFQAVDQPQENEIVNYLEIKYGIDITDMPQDVCTHQDNFNTIPNSFTTLQDSCDKFRAMNLDMDPKDIPEQCKIIPIFKSPLFINPPDLPYQIATPDIMELLTQQFILPGETMRDMPSTPFPGCSNNVPSIPKLPLSQFSIIIPDIKLPDFKLGPFFEVNLPDFIFEDLKFEDVELCNLDDCQFKFPELSFQAPTLQIPEIKIPSVNLNDIPGIPDIIGDPKIEVSVAPPELSPLKLDFSQIINLNSLISPEIQLPNIEFPKPKLEFSFKDLDVDFLGLLLGLFDLNIDFPNPLLVCLPGFGSLDIIPIKISFPNYNFSWPDFPDIPEIPFCKEAREFCRNANSAIQEVSKSAKEIEDAVNYIVSDKSNPDSIQYKFDQAAADINDFIEQKIKDELQDPIDGIAADLKKAINAWLSVYGPETIQLPKAPIPGIFPVSPGGSACQGIPPMPFSSSDIIDIGEIKLSDYIDLPSEIPINWSNFGIDNNIGLSCNEALCDACVNNGVGAECNNYLGPAGECPSFKEWADFEKCRLKYRTKNCKNECKECLSYELPHVPLCGLNYSREETINLPGFQLPTANIDFNSPLGNAVSCKSNTPTGNPCGSAQGDMQSNLDNNIKILIQQTNDASQKIKDILQ